MKLIYWIFSKLAFWRKEGVYFRCPVCESDVDIVDIRNQPGFECGKCKAKGIVVVKVETGKPVQMLVYFENNPVIIENRR